MHQTRKRENFDITLTTKSVKNMIKVLFEHQIDGLKEKVYERITEYIDSEGYPSMSSKYFKETNVNGLVYTIIAPIISDFKRRTNYRNIKLIREKDIISNNYNSTVYGFMTIGDSWQMVVYDGKQFQISEEFKVMFGSMEQDKERWMKDFSIIVDCIYYALSQQTNLS